MKNLIAYVLKTTLLSLASILVFSSVYAEEKRYITPSEHPENVYFGDAHVHTSMSLDAAAWGSRLSPEEVYRYARGEEVTSFKGWKTQLIRPLDWLVIEGNGDTSEIVDLKSEPDLGSLAFDKIVIGASIRYGKHQRTVYDFIKANRATLEAHPQAFFGTHVFTSRGL